MTAEGPTIGWRGPERRLRVGSSHWLGIDGGRSVVSTDREWLHRVDTCPWHPQFPPSAIRSLNGPSSSLPRFRAWRTRRATKRPQLVDEGRLFFDSVTEA